MSGTVLIVVHQENSTPGRVGEMLGERGYQLDRRCPNMGDGLPADLSPYDAVVVFGEDTPLDLIRALKPDVLVKGQDYTVETVVGAEDVQSWGGQVFLAGLLDGHSTTGTVKKLRGG